MGTSTSEQAPLSRKERRKQERKARKQKRAPHASHDEPETTTHPRSLADEKKINSKKSSSSNATKRPLNNSAALTKDTKKRLKTKHDASAVVASDTMDPAMAAAIRRDEEEISALEAKLGLKSSKEKSRLNREYAKLEGYGDDFGEFLDDLDDMVNRVTSPEGDKYYRGKLKRHSDHDDDDEEEEEDQSSLEGPYHSSEDEDMNGGMYNNVDDEDNDDSDEEEMVPMKGPAYNGGSHLDDQDGRDNSDQSGDHDDDDEDESSESESEESDDNAKATNKPVDDDERGDEEANEEDRAEDDSDKDDSEDDASDDDSEDPDHDAGDTYRPIKGEDIYGKSRASTQKSSTSKYVPPHLRKKQEEQSKDRTESLRTIERLLNNSLNRLSEDTLLSVAQAISKQYEDYPKSDLNDSIWKITRNTCVERSFLMTGLTPVYVAALVGVHHLRSSAQLAEHLVELVTTSLCQELENQKQESDQDPETISKKACNLALVLCYLYNFGVVHCNLLYDLIRKLITNFQEVDVEVLLIFLSHCGRSLRSDDPLALKEIVLDVQKRAVQDWTASSSRVEYMLSAMMDLKNNKRRAQDVAFAEKTTKLRKSIGHIKSKVATSNGKANDNSLRITLKDIMEADLKGRWWKVGASWVGNQFKYQDGDQENSDDDMKKTTKSSTLESDERLLKLASKYRMNSDIRRSIFCIIMGAADCDDAFEKIVRAGVLKNRNERDTVRVLMECCGNEKNYNKFYEHLAHRICEYQGRCRFTFQLAFWDVFKQFDEMKLRKAANLAKLLFAMVVQHRILKLNVLKAIDMTSPEELSETSTIFLTIFFSNLLEYLDENAVSDFFSSAIHQGSQRMDTEENEDELDHADEAEALRASFTLFFVQVLKSSPKYKKGSKFRTNLKAAIKACDTESFF